MTKRPAMPIVLVDNSEQRPWTFGPIVVGKMKAPALPTLRANLGEGDYSIAGYQGRLVVERKNGGDFLSTLGQGRARFDREIKRLESYEMAAIIVEGIPGEHNIETQFNWPDVIAGTYDSGIDPGSILMSLGSFWGRSRVWTFFAGTRPAAEIAARSFLLKGAKHMERNDGWAASWRGHRQSRLRRRAA